MHICIYMYSYIASFLWFCIIVACLLGTSSSGSSTDGRFIIGVTMGGGVILLLVIITVVLCIVISCNKRYHKKKTSSDNRVSYSATKPNTNVSDQNPSYDVAKMENNTIKPGDSDGINLYYSTPINTCSKTSEDEPNYAQPSGSSHHLNLTETIKMDTNPSYGISMGEDLGEGVNMDTNPSYGISMKEGSATTAGNTNAKSQQSSYNVTTKQYDYAYTHVNHTKH